MTITGEAELLRERVENPPVNEPTNLPTHRVTFERDEGQEYSVGARVTVHAMNSLFRTIDLNPSTGTYLVARCERVRDVGWQALRVSLQLLELPGTDAAPFKMAAVDRG